VCWQGVAVGADDGTEQLKHPAVLEAYMPHMHIYIYIHANIHLYLDIYILVHI
jgi:hypothetical protein